MKTNAEIISEAYGRLSQALLKHVSVHINSIEEARDIVQDVFMRILGYDIITEETIKSLCYTVANNLVTDHIRRYYKRKEVYSSLYSDMVKAPSLTPEQIATFHDLAEKERCVMMELAPAMKRVYELTRMEDHTIMEIAEQLDISPRTVECHQFKARKVVRERMRRII